MTSEDLFAANLDYAHMLASVALRRLPQHVDRDALINSALIGLWRASERYDPSYAVSFQRYAVKHINGAIVDELRRAHPTGRQKRPVVADPMPGDTWPKGPQPKQRMPETLDIQDRQPVDDLDVGEAMHVVLGLGRLQREVLLDAIRGLPAAVTADRLGSTEASVWWHRAHARNRMRRWRAGRLSERKPPLSKAELVEQRAKELGEEMAE